MSDTDREFHVEDVGFEDYRKASSNGQQVQMSLTGFAKAGKRYRVTKTEDGFKTEEV